MFIVGLIFTLYVPGHHKRTEKRLVFAFSANDECVFVILASGIFLYFSCTPLLLEIRPPPGRPPSCHMHSLSILFLICPQHLMLRVTAHWILLYFHDTFLFSLVLCFPHRAFHTSFETPYFQLSPLALLYFQTMSLQHMCSLCSYGSSVFSVRDSQC